MIPLVHAPDDPGPDHVPESDPVPEHDLAAAQKLGQIPPIVSVRSIACQVGIAPLSEAPIHQPA